MHQWLLIGHDSSEHDTYAPETLGPSSAARILVEVGDITRFPDRGHFASWTGTAPIDACFG